jgi:putative ABC transport system permease protein
VLLAGAGLMLRSFLKLQEVDPGFSSQRIVTFQLQLSNTRFKEPAQMATYYDQLLERISTTPGVEASGLVSDMPFSGAANMLSFTKEGETRTPNDPGQDAEVHTASPDYFQTMGIPLKRGELFTTRDTPNTPGVAVISETAARRYWGDADPIGERVTLDGQNYMKIIGIVGDTRNESLNEAPYPQMYAPIAQQPFRLINLVVRSSSDAASLVPALRQQVRELDGTVPVFNVRTLEQIVADSIARPRLNAMLIILFAALALVLASVGIYGVISYAVSQRQHEIGIRLALGARPTDILRMVVGQGLKLVTAGIGVGLIAVFLLTRLLSTLLFGVSATDSVTLLLVSLILAGVALLACFVPARRATKVDPMVALRYE